MNENACTPPQLARRYGVHPLKVLGWIRNGELRAINVAANRSGRPRWRITPAAIEDFEAGRAAVPLPPPRRQPRRQRLEITEDYFQ